MQRRTTTGLQIINKSLIRLRERFIEKKERKSRQMSVLPLHLPTYSKNRHFFLPLYVTRCVKFVADCWPFSLIFTQFVSFFFLNF